MKDITELTNELSIVFHSLKEGAIKNKDADSLANVAGKLIKAIGMQMEYGALRNRGLIGKIEFLETAQVLETVSEVEPPKIARAK